MEHREFGEEIPLDAQSWTWIKPENNPGKARPAAMDHNFDYVWQSFREAKHESEQQVWWPIPPPEYHVIHEGMLEMCSGYEETIGY